MCHILIAVPAQGVVSYIDLKQKARKYFKLDIPLRLDPPSSSEALPDSQNRLFGQIASLAQVPSSHQGFEPHLEKPFPHDVLPVIHAK
jgi:hypothetical protein